MSSRILCTFGGRAYDRTTEITVRDAAKFGVDRVLVYDDKWLVSTRFHILNKEWWNRPDTKHHGPMRGFGWFVWKPYIIAHALSLCAPGDTVLFIDADTYPIADLSPIYDECARIGGLMLFEATGCWHHEWCKRDCFIRMGMDEDRWRLNVKHAVARFMLFRKQERSAHFLDEWQRYCLDTHANTFDASVLAPEYPELREHRCEQAILTNLAHKYGHKLYREACQFGNSVEYDKKLYPQLFVQEDCQHQFKLDLSGSQFRNIE